MGYIGQAPTKIPLTSSDITDGTIALADMAANSVDSDQYVDGSIDLAHIATNQIDETLIKDAFVGDFSDVTVTAADTFLYGDATDSGNTKKDTVQGILDLGGGAWNLIGTSVASTSATLTVTGLDSTYDTFAIALSDMHPVDDGVGGHMRFGDSSGIDSGSSDYSSFYQFISSGSYSGSGSATTNTIYLSYATGNAAGEGLGALMYLHRPGDGSTQPMISGTQLEINASTAQTGGVIMAKRNAVITLDRVQFLFATGSIVSGRMTVWGISHA